jgi:hypothetical protein
MKLDSLIATCLSGLLLASCASSPDTPGDGGTDASPEASPTDGSAPEDASDAGDAGSADGDAAVPDSGEAGPADAPSDAWMSPCPATPPALGTSCASFPVNLACSWGTDPRFGCRTEMWCDWQTTTWLWFAGDPFFVSSATQPLCSGNPPSCPITPPPLVDGGWVGGPPCSMDQDGLTCVYGTTAFTCADCQGGLCLGKISDSGQGGPNLQWYQTTLDAQCPTVLPNWGDPRSASGLVCNYNDCADDETNRADHGTVFVCDVAGVWQSFNADLDAGNSCP